MPVLCSHPLPYPRSLGGIAWPGSPQGSTRPTAPAVAPSPRSADLGGSCSVQPAAPPPGPAWTASPSPIPGPRRPAGSDHALQHALPISGPVPTTPSLPRPARLCSGHALPHAPPIPPPCSDHALPAPPFPAPFWPRPLARPAHFWPCSGHASHAPPFPALFWPRPPQRAPPTPPCSDHALPSAPRPSRPGSGHALPRAPPCFLRNADQPLVNTLPSLFRESAGPVRTGAVSRSSVSERRLAHSSRPVNLCRRTE